jgi:4-hydroxy-3-methylbut-2-enyl diphosphate reductase
MEIVIGRYAGYCSGVRNAVTRAERILNGKRTLFSLGEIVHNPQTVRHLEGEGMKVVKAVEEIPRKSAFIVRSHGLPSDILARLKKRKLDVTDGTCPRVRKIHKLVAQAVRKRQTVVIIGKSSHPEVQGIASLGRKNLYVVENTADTAALPRMNEVVVVVQTTFNPDSFCDVLCSIVLRARALKIFNTLCDETRWRQEEVRFLAGSSDLVIVVGGKNSSNTKTLFEIAIKAGRAYHIDGPDEILPEWFAGVKKTAVVSGASTPVEDVNQVAERIREIAGRDA